jgi:hypothetical protein
LDEPAHLRPGFIITDLRQGRMIFLSQQVLVANGGGRQTPLDQVLGMT